jgi:EAL domain-containing protein (putative c-di-GMP-specific phosphodiesterase class I)
MKRNLDALVYAGFTIAVDDFGTGYSNISGLMDLPFRIVKIDRSLIEAMDRSKNGKLGLEGVVTMFRHMSTQLVAEGVETADQVSRVQEMGIDFIQGYYYSRPVPPEAFMEFLAKEGSVCTG